ncbi:MAG TPA: MFS transporter [Candidatus Aquilonibacter sp.]|nr:MFS transporter [Candidatus Aquilonibacter sp.]
MATGISVALPGALLPLLLSRWHLGDVRGGLLLFCFFIATTTGALLSRGVMNRSVARGSVLAAVGAAWLGLANRGWAFAAIALFGLGLGIAMTSTSLLVSRRWPEERRTEMMRLNLLWAAGACAGPWLGLGGRALRSAASTSRPLHVLAGLAVFFVAWAVWMWIAESDIAPSSEELQGGDSRASAKSGHRWLLLTLPLPVLVILFSATGVESSTGGWLTAYTQRLGETAPTTIGAATAFWVGLLTSRFVHSIRQTEHLRERGVLAGSALLMSAGLVVLIAGPAGFTSVVAAFAVGFGVGPMYPLALTIALRRCESLGAFVLAGFGSATLPLFTGTVSSWSHSLAAGLGVPLAAAAVMVIAGLRSPEDPRAVAFAAPDPSAAQ